MSATDDQLTTLTRIIGTEIQTSAGRLGKALVEISNCTGPLRASSVGQSPATAGPPREPEVDLKPNHSDPTGEYVANNRKDEAEIARKRIERLVITLAARSKELDTLLNIWNPTRARQEAARGVKVTNEDMWCPNPAHGANREPREPGKRHCWFCEDIKMRYGQPPDAKLIDAKSRRRVSSSDVEAFLRRIGSNKTALVPARD